MFRTSILIIVVFLTGMIAGQAQQVTPVYFAAGSEGLNPFMAYFQNGQFKIIPRISDVLEHFQIDKKYSALNESGKTIMLTVSNHNPEADYFEQVIQTKPLVRELAITTSPAIPLTFLVANPITLSSQELKLLQNKAVNIWKKERLLFSKSTRPSVEITLLTHKIQCVSELPNIISVYFPTRFMRNKITDDRGSFFFLFNRHTQQTLIGYFGHPEWSPNAPDSIVSIKPRIFFKIGDSSVPYILADYRYGWESDGLAIINLLNGNVEARTFFVEDH